MKCKHFTHFTGSFEIIPVYFSLSKLFFLNFKFDDVYIIDQDGKGPGSWKSGKTIAYIFLFLLSVSGGWRGVKERNHTQPPIHLSTWGWGMTTRCYPNQDPHGRVFSEDSGQVVLTILRCHWYHQFKDEEMLPRSIGWHSLSLHSPRNLLSSFSGIVGQSVLSSFLCKAMGASTHHTFGPHVHQGNYNPVRAINPTGPAPALVSVPASMCSRLVQSVLHPIQCLYMSTDAKTQHCSTDPTI